MQDFSRLHLDDAEIISLFAKGGNLKVVYSDWQKNLFALTFMDVLGFEAFGVEGEDISHGTESAEDPFIKKAAELARDSIEGAHSYVIWSAWSDQPILRVAARYFAIAPLTEDCGVASKDS